jgi:hypothetical protein
MSPWTFPMAQSQTRTIQTYDYSRLTQVTHKSHSGLSQKKTEREATTAR